MVCGVNGAGKTTTIAKLAKQLQSQGKTVLLGGRRVFDNLRKKKLEEEAARKQGPPAGDGEPSVLLFMITAEITSISKDKAADELFTIPAGWQQVQENP
jgi:fused signal recognition particle receptor